MDTSVQLQKPAATLQLNTNTSQADLLSSSTTEHYGPAGDGHYDPCENAQKFSPFYQYNHDSPRPSTDARPKQSIHVSVRDLELGAISPSITQEKISAQKQHGKFTDKLKFWQKRQECLTRPKKQMWLQRLPKNQQIAAKVLIAVLIAGTMIGIAVGIASALNSGVNGSDKTVGEHQ